MPKEALYLVLSVLLADSRGGCADGGRGVVLEFIVLGLFSKGGGAVLCVYANIWFAFVLSPLIGEEREGHLN